MKKMRTRTHGYLDYLVCALIIITPWLLGFNDVGPSTLVLVFVGLGILIYSLMTDYELGIAKKISMRSHLTLDILSGLLLAVSPWLFGFADEVSTPHVMMGIIFISMALVTTSRTSKVSGKRHHHRRSHRSSSTPKNTSPTA